MEVLVSPKFASNAEDLILAMGYGVQEEMSRFVRSWLPFAAVTRMALLLLREQDLEINKYLQGWGVELRHITIDADGRPELERYKMFERYLAEPAQAGIKYVLITDVRDVVVQGNPFAAVRARWPGKLLFTSEDERLSLGTCPFNSRWLKHLFGPSVVAQLGPHAVSCSGVTLGAVDVLRHYLRGMSKWSDVSREAKKKAGMELAKGSDQGLHNCIVHGVCDVATPVDTEPTLNNSVLLPNGVLVLNMAWLPDEEVRIDHFGRVRLSGNNGMPAILHQFDRHLQLVALQQRMYPVVQAAYFSEELRLLKWLLGDSSSSAANSGDKRW